MPWPGPNHRELPVCQPCAGIACAPSPELQQPGERESSGQTLLTPSSRKHSLQPKRKQIASKGITNDQLFLLGKEKRLEIQ